MLDYDEDELRRRLVVNDLLQGVVTEAKKRGRGRPSGAGWNHVLGLLFQGYTQTEVALELCCTRQYAHQIATEAREVGIELPRYVGAGRGVKMWVSPNADHALVCNVEIVGVTVGVRELGYGADWLIGETLSVGSMKVLARGLGGEFVDSRPVVE